MRAGQCVCLWRSPLQREHCKSLKMLHARPQHLQKKDRGCKRLLDEIYQDYHTHAIRIHENLNSFAVSLVAPKHCFLPHLIFWPTAHRSPKPHGSWRKRAIQSYGKKCDGHRVRKAVKDPKQDAENQSTFNSGTRLFVQSWNISHLPTLIISLLIVPLSTNHYTKYLRNMELQKKAINWHSLKYM